MVAVKLRILECIDTKGEREEEPYLCVSVDGSDPITFGPWEMRQGDTHDLYYEIPEFEGNEILVGLSEEDWSSDEDYGSVRIAGHEEPERESGPRRVTEEDRRIGHFDARMVEYSPHGRYVVNLPPQGPTRYKL